MNRSKASHHTVFSTIQAIEYAESLGSTFSCESANDLPEIAREMRLGISPRSVALLRFYASDEYAGEDGPVLDAAIAKALLAFAGGADEGETLDAIRRAVADFEASFSRCECRSSGSMAYCGKCRCGWVARATSEAKR